MGRSTLKTATNPSHYPRAVAVRVLTRVLSDQKPLDEALASVIAEDPVSPAARAWLQEVCSGALRWKGRLDFAIDSVAMKKKPTGWLRKILLISAYQLIAQDRTQPAAVVSETVNEIKKKEGEAPAKFANACLRRIGEHAKEFRGLEFPKGAEEGAIRAWQWASLPEWLWKRLVSDRGEAWAIEYARASLDRPQTWVRAREPESLVAAGAESGPVSGSFRITAGGAIQELPGFREGAFFVQDISSQVLIHEISAEVRRALGDAPLQALDLCAAPGGKSAGLAWNGFQVSATDRADKSESRFRLLRETIERVAPQVQVIARAEVDALQPRDLVWVDAPCSGSGILRRHPDARWLRQEGDVASLKKIQAELLQEAWDKVKPGGFLAYSVCSVLAEEGPGQIENAGLKAHLKREWFLCPQNAPSGDGFWAALFRK